MNRVAVVRQAFEDFNRKHFDRVLDAFDPDVEVSDGLRPGVVVRGREAALQLWIARFDQATAHVLVDEVFEVDDSVLASVRIQAYTERGASFGREFRIVYRYIFRDDVVVRLESHPADEVPESIRILFGVG